MNTHHTEQSERERMEIILTLKARAVKERGIHYKDSVYWKAAALLAEDKPAKVEQSEREELINVVLAEAKSLEDRGEVYRPKCLRRAAALLSTDAKPSVDGELPPLSEMQVKRLMNQHLQENKQLSLAWDMPVYTCTVESATELIRAALLAATPARQWVGLTDDEIDTAYEDARQSFRHHQGRIRGQQVTPQDDPNWHFVRAIESKLREKNAALLAEDKAGGEPVAWMMEKNGITYLTANWRIAERDGYNIALYTHPQPQAERVPEGWKLVPVEPTLEMLDALRADTTPNLLKRYRAMLAAAPKPQDSKETWA